MRRVAGNGAVVAALQKREQFERGLMRLERTRRELAELVGQLNLDEYSKYVKQSVQAWAPTPEPPPEPYRPAWLEAIDGAGE